MCHITRNLLSAAIAAAFCASCTTLGKVDSNATLEPSGDAFFVIGVSPEKTRVRIDDGILANGDFEKSTSANVVPFAATLMNTPTDGYLVGKAKGGTTLGLTAVFDESGWPAVAFAPCKGGAKTPVFTLKAGTVVYITSMSYIREADRIKPSFADNFGDAQAFMKTHYPNLADKLERGHYEMAPSGLDCSKN